ncbi:MAG: lipoprotein signal peptidase [Methyloversatilis sp.]|nr:lipoprotein signal peptidase [Methyloversatilis sp.]MBP6192879.1 lipoprotein signal peptidase [Methyloversatilis sp.]MBP9116515.1 lipoprotein signal peptidase [Methyloversatilis sp.]
MTPRLAGWLLLALLVVGADQLTKYLITQWLSYGQSWSVTHYFDLVLVYNPGAAFSFLADHSGWQRWFFIVLTSAVSVWLILLMRRHVRQIVLPLGLALILGGAIGNLIDRVILGAVVDFLYFHLGSHGFPAFNVADSAITLGVVLMLVDQFGLLSRSTRPETRA